MNAKKLKHQAYLNKYPNCPPDSYEELSLFAYRWVYKMRYQDSFLPLNLIKNPPQRVLDDYDLCCKGYGLSLFDTFDNGLKMYKKLYDKRRAVSHEDFIAEKGDTIALLDLQKGDGIAGDKNEKSGHFTFHEYEQTNLTSNIQKCTDIFDEDGNFNG